MTHAEPSESFRMWDDYKKNELFDFRIGILRQLDLFGVRECAAD